MKHTTSKYYIFILTAVFMVVCSLVPLRQTFDIRIFDTFYVFPLRIVYRVLAFLLLVLWGIYTFAHMFIPCRLLTRLNILLTVFACISIVCFHSWTGQLSFTNKPYPINDVPLFYRNNIRLLILLFFFALAQIPLLINLIKGIIKSVKGSTPAGSTPTATPPGSGN